MNSAMPRLRVFVAVNESISLGDLSSKVTQHTFIRPFFELLVSGSLLHKVENLNIILSEMVGFSRWRSSPPDCSIGHPQEAMLYLGWWDQTSRMTIFRVGDLTPVRSLVGRVLLLTNPNRLGSSPICPDFCGFETPKMAKSLSRFCGFERKLREIGVEPCPDFADLRLI